MVKFTNNLVNHQYKKEKVDTKVLNQHDIVVMKIRKASSTSIISKINSFAITEATYPINMRTNYKKSSLKRHKLINDSKKKMIKKPKRGSYTYSNSIKLFQEQDDSFELNDNNNLIKVNQLAKINKDMNLLKALSTKNEETKKMYHRIADLQNLNLNLFKQGTRIGKFKLDNTEFNRIYSKIKSK